MNEREQLNRAVRASRGGEVPQPELDHIVTELLKMLDQATWGTSREDALRKLCQTLHAKGNK